MHQVVISQRLHVIDIESDLQRIVLGRFDKVINLIDAGNPQHRKPVRIGSTKPSDVPFFNFEPIGTDGEHVFYRGERHSARDWLSKLDRKIASRLIVLTIKERNLLLETLVDMDCDVGVLETKFPIFDGIRYVSNIESNYATLVRMLSRIRKMGLRGRSIGDGISTEFLYRIERKLRFKNGLDRYFAQAYHLPYQEVFKLKEERPDRAIVAFDFNSMYASCMREEFLEPKSIRHVDLRNSEINITSLAPGLYRTLLRHPKPSFFKTCHPFRYIIGNKNFYFNLNDSHEVEVLLFRDEIQAYAKYFGEVKVLEGFISQNTVTHPLLRKSESIYRERQNYKAQSSKNMEALSKFRLATMHSATNQKRYVTRHFQTISDLIDWVDEQGFFDFSDAISLGDKLRIALDHRTLRIKQTPNGFTARLIRLDSPDNVFSLSAQIISNSRTKMLRVIERFLSHPSVELCYCNVDSLHISILKSELDYFLKSHCDIISGRMGDLKIQTIADKGYWFDIGRYWLFNGNEVNLYKNKIFNHKGSTSPFTRFRKVGLICKGDLFNYLKPLNFTISKSLSYVKKAHDGSSLDTVDYHRYFFHEVENFDQARASFDNEILRSRKLKIDLFDRISTCAAPDPHSHV